MRSWRSSALRSAVAVFCLFSIGSRGESKTIDDYWNEVDIAFSNVDKLLTEESCYEDERAFLACTYALDAVVARLSKGSTLIPSARLREPGFGKLVVNFGAVAVVGAKRFDTTSVAETYAASKKERAHVSESWKTLFKGPKVPFEKVVTWVREQPDFAKREKLLAAAGINTMLGIVNDPHTMYVPKKYVEEVEMAPAGNDIVGIGVSVRLLKQGNKEVLVVTQPTEGGPALAAGVRANDVIREIDGKSVDGLTLSEAVNLIRGEEGSAVTVTFLRKGTQKVVLTIVRRRIQFKNVVAKMITTSAVPLAYVKLRTFMQQNGCTELTAAMKKLEKDGARGFVFDLRDNGGGLVTQGVCVANAFLPKGKVVLMTKDLSSQSSTMSKMSTSAAATTELPVVTLVNAGSASASEIVSGALQDHRRAFLVGERSFGKATVQRPEPKGDLVLRRTIARFYLPSGRTNQVEGVLPDVTAYRTPTPSADDMVAFREEDEYMALPPLGTPWQQPRPQVIGKLDSCMGKTGQAKKLFAAGQDDAIAPDYALLVAADAATCAVAEGIGKTLEALPLPQAPLAPEAPKSHLERLVSR